MTGLCPEGYLFYRMPTHHTKELYYFRSKNSADNWDNFPIFQIVVLGSVISLLDDELAVNDEVLIEDPLCFDKMRRNIQEYFLARGSSFELVWDTIL